MRISADNARNSVTLFYEGEFEYSQITSKAIAELTNGSCFSDFDVEIKKHNDSVSVTYYKESFILAPVFFNQIDEKSAIDFIQQYATFALNPENREYILDFGCVFVSDSKLRFVKALTSLNQNPVNEVQAFINGTASCVNGFNSSLKDALLRACNLQQVEYEIQKAVEEYLNPPKNEASAERSYNGETTLLGFTNFGETSVLGGVPAFETPNLVRVKTNEKIFITKRSFLIGKNPQKNDYAVEDNSAVSRVHAEITVVGSEYYIIDKGSTNHTYVNNTQIPSASSVRIFDGDEIKIANEVFIFHLQ